MSQPWLKTFLNIRGWRNSHTKKLHINNINIFIVIKLILEVFSD